MAQETRQPPIGEDGELVVGTMLELSKHHQKVHPGCKHCPRLTDNVIRAVMRWLENLPAKKEEAQEKPDVVDIPDDWHVKDSEDK